MGLTRRHVIRLSALGATTVLLAACGQTAAPSPTTAPTAAPTTAPTTAPTAAPTTASAAASTTPAATQVASAGGRANVVKVVSSLPHTGGGKGLADAFVNGIKMAIEDVGSKAGSFAIEYEPWDDAVAATGKWDAGKEADNANKAVADADIMLYIGTYNSGAAKISIPILNKASLAMISPGNTYPGLTKKVAGAVQDNEPDVYYPTGKRNYCRVVPSDELQGVAAANWAKDLGGKAVGVLDDTELYGHGLALVFADKAKKLGMQVTGPQGIDRSASDYRSIALQLKSQNVDLVFYSGITTNNAGKLFQDLRSILGQDAKLMGPDGIFDADFIKSAGDAAEGAYITFGGVPANKLTGKGADFYQKYKDKYKIEPEAYAAYGYEASAAGLAAITKAGKKDRETIRATLLATKEFTGVLGSAWSFTETGDTTLTTMSGNTVKSGKFEFVKLLEAK